jgi:hypothetical protein
MYTMIGRIQGAHYWKKSTLGMLDRLELGKKDHPENESDYIQVKGKIKKNIKREIGEKGRKPCR